MILITHKKTKIMDESINDVTLHVYDLSQGMASTLSKQIIGKHLDGIWFVYFFLSL